MDFCSRKNKVEKGGEAWGGQNFSKTAAWGEGMTVFALRRRGYIFGKHLSEGQHSLLKMFVFVILWSSVE